MKISVCSVLAEVTADSETLVEEGGYASLHSKVTAAGSREGQRWP